MQRLQTILFPTDLSEASVRAFPHARFLAERFDARLTLYHALEIDARPLALIEVDESRLMAAAEVEARARLATLTQGLSVPHDVLIEKGVIVPALADVAVLAQIARSRPDLTVMATHSRKGVGSYFIGTVAERVIREARTPVLVVRESADDEVFPYRRLLVTTDFSPASRRAFPWSRRLAHDLSALLVALHVAAKAAVDGDEAIRQLDALKRFVTPEHEGLDIRPLVAHGTAWREIVAVAARERIDLILMSTKGHDSLADDVMGSHADRVIRHAPCPVLIVG
jgi:nucleotide-binding universal stress UspA family protein